MLVLRLRLLLVLLVLLLLLLLLLRHRCADSRISLFEEEYLFVVWNGSTRVATYEESICQWHTAYAHPGGSQLS